MVGLKFFLQKTVRQLKDIKEDNSDAAERERQQGQSEASRLAATKLQNINSTYTTFKYQKRTNIMFSSAFWLYLIRNPNRENHMPVHVMSSLLTFLLDEIIHFLLYTVVPVGDIHMQGVVTAGFLISPLPPLVIGLHQAGARLWDNMVHWYRCKVEDGECDEEVTREHLLFFKKKMGRRDRNGDITV